MSNNFEKTADAFFNSPQGAKFSGKKDELSKLANSPEGRRVKNMMGGNNGHLMSAIEKGDMSAVSNTLSEILKTPEGSSLAQKLMDMMK